MNKAQRQSCYAAIITGLKKKLVCFSFLNWFDRVEATPFKIMPPNRDENMEWMKQIIYCTLLILFLRSVDNLTYCQHYKRRAIQYLSNFEFELTFKIKVLNNAEVNYMVFE